MIGADIAPNALLPQPLLHEAAPNVVSARIDPASSLGSRPNISLLRAGAAVSSASSRPPDTRHPPRRGVESATPARKSRSYPCGPPVACQSQAKSETDHDNAGEALLPSDQARAPREPAAEGAGPECNGGHHHEA